MNLIESVLCYFHSMYAELYLTMPIVFI